MTTLRLIGSVPPEVWNRLGTKVLPKLRSGDDLSVGIEFSVSVSSAFAMTSAFCRPMIEMLFKLLAVVP